MSIPHHLQSLADGAITTNSLNARGEAPAVAICAQGHKAAWQVLREPFETCPARLHRDRVAQTWKEVDVEDAAQAFRSRAVDHHTHNCSLPLTWYLGAAADLAEEAEMINPWAANE